jgi:ribosome-associated heat shock protein Hsp15
LLDALFGLNLHNGSEPANGRVDKIGSLLDFAQDDRSGLLKPTVPLDLARDDCYRNNNCREDLMRIDKWLWAARFFKTRSLASKACELGRVESTGVRAKPSREVQIGDLLSVKNESGEFQIEVKALSETRGPAAIAQTLYAETQASRELRAKLAEERKLMPHFEDARENRPSKRDRRQLHRFRDGV